MTPKLFRAADVCELAQLQPYVLRSWEKEFPGIGLQKGAESPRLYRQSDVDQVLRIKQLVFSEGLTLAGARRRLEESAPRTAADERQDVAEVLDALSSDARTRIAHVKDGLRAILQMLGGAPGTVVVVDVGSEPPGKQRASAAVRTLAPRGRAESGQKAPAGARKTMAKKTMAKVSRPLKGAKPKVKAAVGKVLAKGAAKNKRSRASA
jgi:DNA-binding transcriptional MerR regulator